MKISKNGQAKVVKAEKEETPASSVVAPDHIVGIAPTANRSQLQVGQGCPLQVIQTYQLKGGKVVSKDFYDMLLLNLKNRIPQLNRNCVYTARKLCGEGYWKPLDKGECIMAGRCITDMAEKRLLPLIPKGKTSSNWLLYQLV